ncbi:MAG: hypothetical protein JRH20_01730 [Deltaproteobacteria bacterium]|nr:hypothetical protein [Deltaproteobacteria bacterium]
MAKSRAQSKTVTALALRGLSFAPSQSWGGVRLVPLLREEVRDDLRLTKREYTADVMAVDVGNAAHWSFVPHGIVAEWSTDGTPIVPFGTQVRHRDGKHVQTSAGMVQLAHRMVRREEPTRLRFLPLHLAMEGYLAHFFGGPEIAWGEYSKGAISTGLSPRVETSVSGAGLPGLSDALRIFEIHEGQVGILLYVGGALGAAFVVPHPEDYRALHTSLIEDFYGELLVYYGLQATAERMECALPETKVSSLGQLRGELSAMRAAWATFQEEMGHRLLERELTAQVVYSFGPFSMQHFSTDLRLKEENHLGEVIMHDDGTLQYLKTYRLSAAQARRAYLLKMLAACHWNIEATARSLGQSNDEFVLRLDKAGFDYLLKEHVLAAARRHKRNER